MTATRPTIAGSGDDLEYVKSPEPEDLCSHHLLSLTRLQLGTWCVHSLSNKLTDPLMSCDNTGVWKEESEFSRSWNNMSNNNRWMKKGNNQDNNVMSLMNYTRYFFNGPTKLDVFGENSENNRLNRFLFFSVVNNSFLEYSGQ